MRMQTGKFAASGDHLTKSYGANRGTARLQFDGDVAVVGDKRVKVTDNRLFLWHDGEAGSFHGVFAGAMADRAITSSWDQFERAQAGITEAPAIAKSESRSGAGDAVAAAYDIPDGGLYVLTSGYSLRRGHTVWHVTAAGVSSMSRDEARAQRAEVL